MAKWKLTAKNIEEQIAEAKHQTRIAETLEPRAETATYDKSTNRITVSLTNGSDFGFSASAVPELATASPKEIAQIEISPSGRTLRWKALDADLSLPGLMMGVFGSRLWMAQLGQKGGQATSAKKVAAARLNGKKGGRPKSPVVYDVPMAASSTMPRMIDKRFVARGGPELTPRTLSAHRRAAKARAAGKVAKKK
jgi:hypothetical protein